MGMRTKLTVLLILVLLPAFVFSQTTRVSSKKLTKPFAEIGISFGYALPMFSLNGSSTVDFYDLSGYATSNGYYGTIDAKFTLVNFKPGQLRLTWLLGYARFFGDENRAYLISTHPEEKLPVGWPKSSYYFTSVSGSSSTSFHHPFTAVGLDYAVYADKERRSIFNFGGDIAMSGIFGKVYNQRSGFGENQNSTTSAIRFGLAANVGYTFRAVDWLGFHMGARFHLSNLVGKSSETISSEGEVPLNDSERYDINPNLNTRHIGYTSFYGGVSFFIGGKR